jgi:hypothetical protein
LDSPVSNSELLRTVAESNPHLRWRAAQSARFAFGEKPDQRPPEALLQRVWLYQRLLHERLQTTDGRKVRVLHPGFWNHEPGPDFRRALVQIGTERPVLGDIEIDLLPSGWEQHGHSKNPAYRNVVLHVTWEPESATVALPNLPLKHALDSTLPELSFWLGLEPKPSPEGLAGKCSAPFRTLSPEMISQVLRQAAQARLLRKAEQIQARARQVEWEGAAWESLFSALGYKRNTWPMRRLAELLPVLRRDLAQDNEPVFTLQARMLGAAGLLPAELPLASGGEYIRRVWNVWWREADSYSDSRLPIEIWTLGGIRPANHPQRRIATASHWALRPRLLDEVDRWIQRKIESPDLVESLTEILQIKHDEFWSYHWTLKSTTFREPQLLLGEQRITDLTINVILPWLYVRALSGRNETLARTAESRYFLWPAGEDNSVLKLARQRLFGGISAKFLKTAAQQQGLLQIVRDFCDHADSACNGCQFPELLGTTVARG